MSAAARRVAAADAGLRHGRHDRFCRWTFRVFHGIFMSAFICPFRIVHPMPEGGISPNAREQD